MCGVRVGTAAAIGWALFATSACGFLGLDGLTGGDAGHSSGGWSSGSGGDDGAPPDGDNVSPEATADVESVRDSSTDHTTGGGDAGTTTGTWCTQLSPAPAFCADYDEGQLRGAFEMGSMVQVPAPTVDNGGSVSLDMTNPSSPPASCTSAVDVLGDADVQARFLNPVTLTNTNTARLRFDMRIDADDPNSAYVADVFFNNGSSQEYVQLSISTSGGFIRWQGALTSAKSTFTEPKVGVWTKNIEMTGNVQTGTLELRIGGTQVASITTTLPFNTSDSSTFYLGLHCFSGSKQITFDNVVFTP
jgi:hypothetical protein